jgi:hypothetical protein
MDDFELRMAKMETMMRSLQDTQIVMASIQERQARVQKLQAGELDAMRARFERIETSLAEAGDKINALVTMMAQHVREPHPGQSQ